MDSHIEVVSYNTDNIYLKRKNFQIKMTFCFRLARTLVVFNATQHRDRMFARDI